MGTATDRMWSLTRKGAPPDSWAVIVREPFLNVSGRAVAFSTVHRIGLVYRDAAGWTADPDGSVRAGGFAHRDGAAQCVFDDWNTSAAAHTITARIRTARSNGWSR